MRVFRRIGDILSANLNELVDRCEDPEKMLKQAAREMEQALEETLDGAVRVVADEKLLARKISEHREQAEHWRRRARQAVEAGDEAMARRALARRAEHQRLAAALEDQLALAAAASRRLRRQIEAMRAKTAEANRKLATLTARKRSAEARRRFGTTGAAALHGTATARFQRWSEAVDRMEAEADALLELTGDADEDDQLPTTDDVEIEDELAALKADCGQAN